MSQESDSYKPETTSFRSWKDMADGYNLPNKYDIKTQTRMMKILQAIDWNNLPKDIDKKELLSVDFLARFANATIKDGVDKAIEEFGNKLPVDRIKLLKVINTAGGVDGNVYIPDLYNSDGTTIQYNEPKTAQNIVMSGRGTVKVVDEPMPDEPQIRPKYETKQTQILDSKGNIRTQYFRKSVDDENWVEISKEEYEHIKQ